MNSKNKKKLIFILVSVFILSVAISARAFFIPSGKVLGIEKQDLIVRRVEVGGEIGDMSNGLGSENIDGGKKLVALTFDDGPAPITKDILKVLEEESVLATFFVVGQNIDDYKEILIEAHEKGHEIGNHTNTHPFTLWMSQQGIAKNILIGEEKIYQEIGVRPRLLRAPYGFYPKNLLDVAEMFNMILISWDVDPEDWKKIDGDEISDHVTREVLPGSIVLLHDGPPGLDRANTLSALRTIINDLRNDGYQFVTVSELLKLNLSDI